MAVFEKTEDGGAQKTGEGDEDVSFGKKLPVDQDIHE
jgi:hypothetical protein